MSPPLPCILPVPVAAVLRSLQGRTDSCLFLREKVRGIEVKVQPSCLRVVTVCCWLLGGLKRLGHG